MKDDAVKAFSLRFCLVYMHYGDEVIEFLCRLKKEAGDLRAHQDKRWQRFSLETMAEECASLMTSMVLTEFIHARMDDAIARNSDVDLRRLMDFRKEYLDFFPEEKPSVAAIIDEHLPKKYYQEL